MSSEPSGWRYEAVWARSESMHCCREEFRMRVIISRYTGFAKLIGLLPVMMPRARQ